MRPLIARLSLLAAAAVGIGALSTGANLPQAKAGENANMAAAELLHTAAPALADTLQTRFAADYAGLMPQAVALAMLPGVGGSQADAQRRAEKLIAGAVMRIRQRDGELVVRAPASSLRRLAAADHDLIKVAADHDPALCAALEQGHDGSLPAGPVSTAFNARSAALLVAIADGRDQPQPARSATPEDYKDLLLTVPDAGIEVPLPQLCAAMLRTTATLMARHDAASDRLLADRAAGMTRRGP